MLAGWLPIALVGWSLPVLVAGMVLVDVAVQTVHVVSQSQVTVVDSNARSSLVAAYMVCYTIGSAAGAAASTALHAAHGWAAVAILGAAISGAGLVYWAASGAGNGVDCSTQPLRRRRPGPAPHRARPAATRTPELADGAVELVPSRDM
jgi:MFS family permease